MVLVVLGVVVVVLEVVLVVLEVVLVVLEVVLVVLEVTRPQVPWGVYEIRLSLRPDLYSPAPPIPKLKLQVARFLSPEKLQTPARAP